ncbi:MAG: AAA family ATPase [Bacilli bacterium]|nr:AAA family ATPase [Bacilli bacterium]
MKNLRKGKVVCITSGKGGVGKTTLTANLAGIIESMNKKVLLIDLDLTNGGLALMLNTPYKKNICNMLYDIEHNTYDSLNDYVVKYDDYIDILPASTDPRDFNKINNSLINIVLEKASFIYDVILIDMTHILNEINVFALDFCDMAIVVTTNCPMDLKNTKNLVTLFDNLNINKYRILLNESVNPLKQYFSLYDIKSIIKANIDYHISNEFYITDIEKEIMDGKIITLNSKALKHYQNDYTALLNLAADIMGGNKDE